MKPMRKSVAAAAMAASLVTGGIAGIALFGPKLATAQTTTTVPPGSSGTQNGTFKSNEDPTHEANESPEQEAAEDSGTFRGRGGHHGSNEDAAHEANESPEREAAEDAGQTPGASGSGQGSTQGSSLQGASAARVIRL
jgi:hypothetical protein